MRVRLDGGDTILGLSPGRGVQQPCSRGNDVEVDLGRLGRRRQGDDPALQSQRRSIRAVQAGELQQPPFGRQLRLFRRRRRPLDTFEQLIAVALTAFQDLGAQVGNGENGRMRLRLGDEGARTPAPRDQTPARQFGHRLVHRHA